MSAHNLVAQMENVDIGDGSTEHYFGDPNTFGKVQVWGDSVPADGATGYAAGCLFHHLDGGNGTALYVNEGSNTSADFNAILVAA